MGIGNVLTEQLIFDKHGRLVTNGTWDYKPPDTKTIPEVNIMSAWSCYMHSFI